MLPTTEAPYPSFFDLDGTPLDEGKIYYGVANANPVTTPIPIFWDVDGLIPAAQPVPTLNGYTVRFGTPANVYADDPYSISVYDKKGRLVYTDPDSSKYNQLPAYMDDVASITDSAKGSSLVGYLPPWPGAVGQTVSQRLQQRVSAQEFGLKTTNTGAQNDTAIASAIAYAVAQGGLTLHIPRGTYDFDSTINFTGANNLRMIGDGPDATILRITDASADFLSATGSNLYTCFENFTLTSSVTRTGGAMFNGGFWRRALMHRVKITEHFNAINLPGFEVCTLSEVYIVKPSGAGAALTCGIKSAVNVGAGLTLLDCFFRGNNELINDTPPTGLVGVILYDIEAINIINTDMGQFRSQIMVVDPQTRVANCFFLQAMFDGTYESDNVLITGAGIKQQFQFTGCWFNGAGNMSGATAVDCFGVDAIGTGEYYDWNFTGCRFLSTKGSGFYSSSRYLDFNFSGCVFTNTGFGAGVYKHAMHFQPTAASLKSPVITGCKFQDSGARDIQVEANANNVVITGNHLESGISLATGTLLGGCAGNYDAAEPDTLASADPLIVSPTKGYYNITGGVAIGTIPQTFPGHLLTLVTDASLTFSDGATLHLAGNFVTASGSVLTLRCEPAGGGWREVSRTNT